MPKLRISLTVEDFYDYLKTGHLVHDSRKRRVIKSLPWEIESRSPYNVKFKLLRHRSRWAKWYRVHVSVRMTLEELNKMVEENKMVCHRFEDMSYKVIKNPKVKVS